jgi:hypothetical protein
MKVKQQRKKAESQIEMEKGGALAGTFCAGDREQDPPRCGLEGPDS